jgi:hypothetical protein
MPSVFECVVGVLLGIAVATAGGASDRLIEQGLAEIHKPSAAAEAKAREITLSFALPQPGLTSAGIYDATGRLVRVLWTLKSLPAGQQKTTWDGNDALATPAPAGAYTLKVVANRSTYTNIGTIGNTAFPPDSFHHVPINFESVALGRDGAVYTVHDWDEPHNDVIRWSPETGRVLSHSGHPFGGLLKAVAVDDDFVYASGYSDLQDRTKSKFIILRLRLPGDPANPKASAWRLEPFTKAGKHLVVYDGNAAFPAGSSEDDRALMRMPLLSLAVHEGTLYVTDTLAGQVRRYDKVTGQQTGAIDVRLPQAVAVGADGRIWVGHERTKVSVFSADGRPLGTPVTALTNVIAIALGQANTLYVADHGAGQVCVYDLTGNDATRHRVLGAKAEPGDRAADRFRNLHGLAVDEAGNLITAQNEFFFNGGRLAKFAPDGKLVWEQMGLEFSSNGNYDPADPDTFYSFMEHTYRLDRKTGGWQFLGNSFSGTPYRGGPGSALRIGRLGGQTFAFMPAGDGVQVYRIEPAADPNHGPVTRLVSILGRSTPLPTGKHSEESWKQENRYLWSWNDEQGDHTPQPGEIVYWAKPEDGRPMWQFRPITIDPGKNLWITSADRGGNTPEQNSIWMIPMGGTNKLGNPVYEWKEVRRVIAQESLLWPMSMKMAQHGDDGMTYVYGHTKRPGTPQHGGAWMGGNVLAGFEGDQCKWQTVLPDVCVSMDFIPGGRGGCLIGGKPGAGQIHHYTRDGLLIGVCGPDPKIMGAPPNNPSGFLDMYAAVAVNRDPRDGLLDVFVEDNFNLRIAWYRIDDRQIETIVTPFTR